VNNYVIEEAEKEAAGAAQRFINTIRVLDNRIEALENLDKRLSVVESKLSELQHQQQQNNNNNNNDHDEKVDKEFRASYDIENKEDGEQ
jgi:TolA-binding protein